MSLNRVQLINFLAKKINAQRYLEIGIKEGVCFSQIDISNKDGVDPNPKTDSVKFKVTSDEFFKNLKDSIKYDIIFIDGLHTYDQVNRDIKNSLNHLSENGYIVCHDTNPPTKDHAQDYPIITAWNGTVYKSIMELRATRDDVVTITVDSDWGLSILRRGKNSKIKYNLPQDLNWEVFISDRKKALGLISVDEFYKIFKIA